MASSFFPTIFKHMLEGNVDLTTAGQNPSTGGKPVKIMLLKSSYTFDAQDEFVSNLDPGTNEVSTVDTNYGRKVIDVVLSQDINAADDADAGCFLNFDLTAGAKWGADLDPKVTFTCRSAAMFIDSGADATSKLLYFFDFVSDQTVSSGTFTLTNANPQPKLRRYTSGS
jgi:hypothetical protein